MPTHLIIMNAINTFPSTEDFTKKLQDMLPGNLYGEKVTVQFFEQDGTNLRVNKVTIRIVVD